MREFLNAMAVASLSVAIMLGCTPAETENRQQSEAIQQEITRNFGHPGMETSWFPAIVSITVRGSWVEVDTKINRQGSAGKEAGKGICAAISGYIFSNENRALGIEYIKVLGSDGGVVVSRRGLSDGCIVR